MPRYGDLDALNMRLADEQLANRGWRDDYCEILDDIMDLVDEQPTSDVVEVVHAEEIPSAKYGTIDPLVQKECSRCGCGHRKGIIYNGGFNYCPNCGVKMDGGADNAAD